MKKIANALVILAIVLIVGCSNDTASPSVVDFNIPDEFHGGWESVEKSPMTGTTEIAVISATDIVIDGASMEGYLNSVIDSSKQVAEELEMPFNVEFGQGHPREGRYSFSLSTSTGVSTMLSSLTLELIDGQLKFSAIINSTDPYTGEPVTQTETMLYNKI